MRDYPFQTDRVLITVAAGTNYSFRYGGYYVIRNLTNEFIFLYSRDPVQHPSLAGIPIPPKSLKPLPKIEQTAEMWIAGKLSGEAEIYYSPSKFPDNFGYDEDFEAITASHFESLAPVVGDSVEVDFYTLYNKYAKRLLVYEAAGLDIEVSIMLRDETAYPEDQVSPADPTKRILLKSGMPLSWPEAGDKAQIKKITVWKTGGCQPIISMY